MPGKKVIVLSLFLCFKGIACITLPEPISEVFKGHEVIRLRPMNKQQIALLNKMDNEGEVDFWSHSFRLNHSVDIHLTKENKDNTVKVLKDAGINFDVTIKDLDKAINECNNDANGQDRKEATDFSYSKYNTYEQIVSELRNLKNKFPDLATVFSLGRTFEDNQLAAIKISDNKKKNKKIIVIDCGTHAREWISPATCLYIIRELLYKKKEDENIAKLISKYDWVLLPLMNPDGYKYSFGSSGTRLWRKNRSYTKFQIELRNKKGKDICIGVDINRNFGFKWGGEGATGNPCSVIYHGPKPFSEKESEALSEYVTKYKDLIAAHVSLHSFSQVWMPPWGYKGKKPDEYEEQLRVAKIAVKALQASRGTEYEIGNSHDLMYPNSGSSTDWAYGSAGIKYSYTVEMVDQGSKNFLQPKSEIEPNGKEIFEGIKAMAFAMKTDDL